MNDDSTALLCITASSYVSGMARRTHKVRVAEREGFELGGRLSEISKLLNRKHNAVPSDPPASPFLPPDLPPDQAHEKELLTAYRIGSRPLEGQ